MEDKTFTIGGRVEKPSFVYVDSLDQVEEKKSFRYVNA